MVLTSHRRGLRVTAVMGCALASVLLAAGCAKSAESPAPAGGGSGSGGQQEVSGSGASGPLCSAAQYGAPALDLTKATVGFSQSESTSNPFRATETKSITDEAAKLGIKLIQRNANANVPQQNTDIEDMIAQGAQVLIVAPENSDGLAPAFAQAKAKHIPILTIDRTVNGTACSDFIGFIGSDFLGQAKLAADDLGGALNGQGSVAVLQGTSGNNVATDRTNGFNQQLSAKYPGIKVVASQTANFDQATGQKVMEQILQSNPDITGVYAENDTMALGAIQAIRAAGKTPGKDIKIVAIDGTEQCVRNVASGVMVADVETNPRFGPLAFQSLQKFYGGTGVPTGVPTTVIISDHHFTSANAADALKNGDVY
ncbi:MAG: galactofuranose transport system substrate-binding protein [Pseudonocardiales bacterium]|jgi:ribose transport system substrate-binding protein|nr:galactofuranose transport system substrate-binding protein [Pseudonocardiales bacterium]MDT7586997.1 galactofuranose transport system substrate-binding protein [Pseudonocardiales bacterium]MDT7626684.1 galactofuranose transport system substrate-binding protein [Pseudonocardiales bacterium]MDT7640114.1 galactofuranose transport system substrate-binding protein [Pseudonocardiales bacterium]MDT7643886.1 galactofuranose transport system substrate-binding protein [Pseudonocardiales bacterium]